MAIKGATVVGLGCGLGQVLNDLGQLVALASTIESTRIRSSGSWDQISSALMNGSIFEMSTFKQGLVSISVFTGKLSRQ
jgi:hypothetical protein